RFQRSDAVARWLWPLRTPLWNRATFSKHTYKEAGKEYYEFHQIPVERNRLRPHIVFSEVATHNHFTFDMGGKAFDKTAPIITLPRNATVNDHLALLGLLNSSTACFWLKQVAHNKGSTVDQRGARQRTA